MKINAHLTRPRHGVHYYRAIISANYRDQIGCKEIKRSLGTKDPKQAKYLAQHLNLLQEFNRFDYLTMLPLKPQFKFGPDKMIKDFPYMNFDNISKMMVRGEVSGLTFRADPNIPGDKEALQESLLKILS